ncbi:hypothetical protein phi9181_ORF054 [Enterococcus phage 9181]|nr:hypothetical protein phi9181_ORF054 [Enterococcus phage 9181]
MAFNSRNFYKLDTKNSHKPNNIKAFKAFLRVQNRALLKVLMFSVGSSLFY